MQYIQEYNNFGFWRRRRGERGDDTCIYDVHIMYIVLYCIYSSIYSSIVYIQGVSIWYGCSITWHNYDRHDYNYNIYVMYRLQTQIRGN